MTRVDRKAGQRDNGLRRFLPVALLVLVLTSLGYSLHLLWFYCARIETSIYSDFLGESRKVTVYGGNPAVTFYSLDGDKYRHGLLPAAHGTLIAWLSGSERPMIVAIHDEGQRNVDFRPAKVEPASWRPNISGRAAAFDAFLIRELRSTIERQFGKARKRYLFGHSLGGFYVLDLPTRQRRHGFDGLYAFSPTFSHDLSLIGRMAESCAATTHIYANIGLESGRDTAVFEMAAKGIAANPACKGKMQLSKHSGAIHQIVMLSGQIAAFRSIYGRD